MLLTVSLRAKCALLWYKHEDARDLEGEEFLHLVLTGLRHCQTDRQRFGSRNGSETYSASLHQTRDYYRAELEQQV